MAKLVQPDQAMMAAQNYLSAIQAAQQINTASAVMYEYRNGALLPLAEDKYVDENTVLYLIKYADSNYSVVSADDNAYPVLAYSTDNLTNLNDLPPAFYMWMDNYTAQINEIRNTKAQLPEHNSTWASLLDGTYQQDARQTRSIVPLVTTMWNQDWPYNALCPLDPAGPGGRVYVGCVATAMGMVLKYWNQPTTGMGNHSYYANGYGYQNVNFGATSYQWDQMGNTIGTNYLPIATLLYHMAVSVDMNFAPDGSGAQSTDAAEAMVDYFGYPNAEYKSRSSYNQATWDALITAQLDNGSPMYYSGSGSGGGHAFVLDGYDTANHYHFNFGWSGSGNGYYYTTNINPGGSDFNSWQGIIINSIPANYSINTIPVTLLANDTTVGDNFNLSIKTNPILGSWNINHYDFQLYYDYPNVNYVGYSIDGTISQSGDITVTETTPGVISVNWNSSSILSGGGDLIKFTFNAADQGDYLFDLISMNYNTTAVSNTNFVMVNAAAPVATLAQSSITLSNIMHLAYNAIGTTSISTTYLLPSWNVTHYQSNIAYNPEKLEYVGIISNETMSSGLDVQASITAPGVLTISCDNPAKFIGAGTLLKLQFRAIGNGSSLSVTQLTPNGFMFNNTPISAVGTANVILSAYSANEDFVVPVPQPGLEVFPNPFINTTMLKFINFEKSPVQLSIFNLKGQLVNSFSISDAENREITWQGKDAHGNLLGSGIYMLRWQQDEQQGSQKILIVK